MVLTGEKGALEEKLVPVSLRPPQTSQELTWVWTRVSAARSGDWHSELWHGQFVKGRGGGVQWQALRVEQRAKESGEFAGSLRLSSATIGWNEVKLGRWGDRKWVVGSEKWRREVDGSGRVFDLGGSIVRTFWYRREGCVTDWEAFTVEPKKNTEKLIEFASCRTLRMLTDF